MFERNQEVKRQRGGEGRRVGNYRGMGSNRKE